MVSWQKQGFLLPLYPQGKKLQEKKEVECDEDRTKIFSVKGWGPCFPLEGRGAGCLSWVGRSNIHV